MFPQWSGRCGSTLLVHLDHDVRNSIISTVAERKMDCRQVKTLGEISRTTMQDDKGWARIAGLDTYIHPLQPQAPAGSKGLEDSFLSCKAHSQMRKAISLGTAVREFRSCEYRSEPAAVADREFTEALDFHDVNADSNNHRLLEYGAIAVCGGSH
jgi:hypothetical protein